MLFSAAYTSPIGPVTLVSDGTHLVGLWFHGQAHFMAGLTEPPIPDRQLPLFSAVSDWLDEYFSGGKPDPSVIPLRPSGTAFCRVVWQRLAAIPYGEVTTYGALASAVAAELGRETMSARAVGNAVGRNPISLLIPCHRVVGTGGRLTGYAGGLEKKQWLLTLEGAEGL